MHLYAARRPWLHRWQVVDDERHLPVAGGDIAVLARGRQVVVTNLEPLLL
jgi:hypothetical protein